MDGPRQIAARLTEDERDILLSLVGQGEHATILAETARLLQDHGLAVVRPDAFVEVSELGQEVLDILQEECHERVAWDG